MHAAVRVTKELVEGEGSFSSISSGTPQYSIEIPRQLLRQFRNISGQIVDELRVASFIFNNVTGLFPAELPDRNG